RLGLLVQRLHPPHELHPLPNELLDPGLRLGTPLVGENELSLVRMKLRPHRLQPLRTRRALPPELRRFDAPLLQDRLRTAPLRPSDALRLIQRRTLLLRGANGRLLLRQIVTGDRHLQIEPPRLQLPVALRLPP